MSNNLNFSAFSDRSPLHQLFVTLMTVIIVGTLLFALFLLTGSLFFNTDPGVLQNKSMEAALQDPRFIKFTLLAQDISFFIVPGIIILKIFNPGHQVDIMSVKTLTINEVILAAILAICSFPITGLAGQLNSGMVLPDQLSGVEQWMKDKEDYADHVMELIMTPETLRGMWLNILIIAAIPAIGEELIFRGILQKILHNFFRSGHLAVWITSFLFSAIHFQFYGFLPRFILGLIFGYLFLWSRNLWIPVTAHFINNAVPTVGAFIKGWDKINNPVDAGIGTQISGVLVSLTAGILILAWFRRRAYKNIPGNSGGNQSTET
jgi:uncharacterized protein